MMDVIGVDLGNFFTQPCYIEGMDPATRRGGRFYDLVDPSLNMPYGLPTAFFYSKTSGVLCGEQAVKRRPAKNCIRYLKRNLFKNGRPNSVEIDGRTFTYDEMIKAAAQHAIRIAARYLKIECNIETNKISLSYPASMSSFAKNHLVKLMQEITLENGEKIEIVGTIAEPAAAALDYLACSNAEKDETVLVADIGAGTFDVSVVKVYPNGRQYTNGDKYYYDVKHTDGIEDLGGNEFDEVVINILKQKAGKYAEEPNIAELISRAAEPIKRDLSFYESAQPEILLPNGDYLSAITRTEFEKEATPLVERILKMVGDTLEKNSDISIDHIVLTGGASQMPMIERLFKERFSAYKNKICFHMPSKAIASGAARFGVVENFSTEPSGNVSSEVRPSRTVMLRTIRDIGGDYYNNLTDNKGHIIPYIKAGTPIPYTSEWVGCKKLTETSKTRFGIYEARISSPDVNEIQRDYRLVHDHSHDHLKLRPVGYRMRSRVVIDEKHLVFLEVEEVDNPSMGIVRYPFTIDFDSLD